MPGTLRTAGPSSNVDVLGEMKQVVPACVEEFIGFGVFRPLAQRDGCVHFASRHLLEQSGRDLGLALIHSGL